MPEPTTYSAIFNRLFAVHVLIPAGIIGIAVLCLATRIEAWMQRRRGRVQCGECGDWHRDGELVHLRDTSLCRECFTDWQRDGKIRC
jgi:ribosomal protein S14